MEAAGEAEGLEAGVAVLDHLAPDVVVHLLDDRAVGRVDDQADAAEVVVEDAVELAVAFHRARHVGVLGVVEHAAQLAAGVEFGDRAQAVQPQQAVLPHAVLVLGDAPVLCVEVVADQVAIGQRDRAQVAETVVVVARAAVEAGFFFQVAGGAVVVGRALPALQAVFTVVAGNCDAVFVRAVAVGVVAPRGLRAVATVREILLFFINKRQYEH